MKYDYGLTLIQNTPAGFDDIGNTVHETAETDVLCDLRSVTRSEYYQASEAGLNPEIVFEINRFEYSGETEVDFNGRRYSVIRTYCPGYELIELTCERKAGDERE